MSTASSPLPKLKAEASRVAVLLKDAARKSHSKPSVKFAIVMDDKVLTVEMPWTTIRETSEDGLIEYIVKQMQERHDALN